MLYKKQHQSHLREGKEGPQTLHNKIGLGFLNGSKINEDNCKNWFQAFLLETKEASVSYCPWTTKKSWESWSSLVFTEIWHAEGWNCFLDKKIFTLEFSLWSLFSLFNPQNDRMLAWHSEEVPEDMLTVYCRKKLASAMVWAAMSKTWKFTLIFVKQGAKIKTNVYNHWHFGPCLAWYKREFQKWRFHFPTIRCSL